MMTLNPLITHLSQQIQTHNGEISFADYMESVLYHPQLGYYNRKHFDIGKHGDFITAPHISPLFAQCFAELCLQLFPHFKTPVLLEIGGGTGQFAKDLLETLASLSIQPIYYIVEKSVALQKKQQQLLNHFHQQVIWVKEVPNNFSGIILANEVLDALPVHCFQMDNHHILERKVTWQNNQLAWKNSVPSSPLLNTIHALQQKIAFPLHYQSEIHLSFPSFLKSLLQPVDQAMIFLIDYGYGEREYYHPERNRGTLTCFYQHQQHDNPFASPGLEDITAHVNFTHVAEIALSLGTHIEAYTTQAAFLFAFDLMKKAAQIEKEASEKENFLLHQAIKYLTLPTEMGERVKVMTLAKNIDISLPALQWQDRRRDL